MDWWWPAYLILGSMMGFIAGLLGVGGGAIAVPLFVILFEAQHFPYEHVLHLVLGTSLAGVSSPPPLACARITSTAR